MRTILSLFFLFSIHASAGPQMPAGSTYGASGLPGGGTVGQYLSLCSGGPCWAGVSGLAIGSAVTSGTSGSALYVDSSGLLAQSNSLYKFAPTTGGGTAAGSSSSDGVLTVPDGTWSGSPSTFFGAKPGLRFVDDGNSAGDGWFWRKDTGSNVGWMVAAMNGQWMLGFRHNRDGANGGQGSKEIVAQALLRPDTALTINGQSITLGTSGAKWPEIWGAEGHMTYYYIEPAIGGETLGVRSANSVGTFQNVTTGVTEGWTFKDPRNATANAQLRYYFELNDSTTPTKMTQRMGDDILSNSTAAYDLYLQAQNKTAGTGNGGNLVLVAGTSAGGAAGKVKLASVVTNFTPSAQPASAVEGDCYWSSTTHKLTCYDGSAWNAAW
jgi:hypothetical protein